MRLPLPNNALDALSLPGPPTQFLDQGPSMRHANHPILRPMHHTNPLPAHPLRYLANLLRALMVPPGRQHLCHESRPREQLWTRPLPQITCREAIARSREWLHGILELVRLSAVAGRRDEVFRVRELGVEGFGNEEIDAAAEIFEEADGVDQPCGRRDEC